MLILSAFGHPFEHKMSRMMPLFGSGAFIVTERMGCAEVCERCQFLPTSDLDGAFPGQSITCAHDAHTSPRPVGIDRMPQFAACHLVFRVMHTPMCRTWTSTGQGWWRWTAL